MRALGSDRRYATLRGDGGGRRRRGTEGHLNCRRVARSRRTASVPAEPCLMRRRNGPVRAWAQQSQSGFFAGRISCLCGTPATLRVRKARRPRIAPYRPAARRVRPRGRRPAPGAPRHSAHGQIQPQRHHDDSAVGCPHIVARHHDSNPRPELVRKPSDSPKVRLPHPSTVL